MNRITIPPMSPKNRKRSTWAAALVSVVIGLSQVPWAEIGAFLSNLLDVPAEPAAPPEGS
jgi:hypothetical protein